MPIDLCWSLDCLIYSLSTRLPDSKREKIEDVESKEFMRNLSKLILGRKNIDFDESVNSSPYACTLIVNTLLNSFYELYH